MSSNDMAVMDRYVQRFVREGTSMFIRTYDGTVLVHEHECKNVGQTVPNEVNDIARTINAQLALGLVGSEVNPGTGGSIIPGIPGLNNSTSVVAYCGDSLTQAGSYGMGVLLASGKASFTTTPTLTNINSAGTFVAVAQADAACGTGSASLTWTPGGQYGSFTFTAPGDTAGAATQVTGDGFLYVPSATAGKGINLALRTVFVDASTLPTVAKTDTITLSGTPQCVASIFDGYSAWNDLLLKSPFGMSYNFGISGDTPENLLNRASQILAIKPDFVVELSGTNGLAATTLERWKSARLAFWKKCIAANVKKVFVGTVFPNGGSANTEKRRCIIALNRWVREQVRAIPGLVLWDGYSVLTDVNNATAGEPVSRFFKADLLHLTPVGGYVVSKNALAPVMQPYVGPSVAFAASPADVYDATYNPKGNLIPSGYGNFIGTAAAGDLSPATGTLGLGWTNTRSGATMSCVCSAPSDASPIARADRPGENWQRFAVTGTGAAAGDYFQSYLKAPPAPGSGYAIGDTVRLTGVCRISNASGLRGVTIKLALLGAGIDVVAFQSPGGYTLATLEGDTVQFTFASQWITVPTGTTGLKPIISIFSDAGSMTANVDVQDFNIEVF